MGVGHRHLNLLALAQHQDGNTPAAIATEERAISIISKRTPARIRTAYEAALRTYQAALADKRDLPDDQANR